MTEKKTDVLNLRLDAGLAKEIDRIAAWRGKTASEAARELLQYGVQVERGLEADELCRDYSTKLDRNAENVRVEISGRIRYLSYAELAQIDANIAEAEEYGR